MESKLHKKQRKINELEHKLLTLQSTERLKSTDNQQRNEQQAQQQQPHKRTWAEEAVASIDVQQCDQNKIANELKKKLEQILVGGDGNPNAKKRRGKLPDDAIRVLKKWLFDHKSATVQRAQRTAHNAHNAHNVHNAHNAQRTTHNAQRTTRTTQNAER